MKLPHLWRCAPLWHTIQCTQTGTLHPSAFQALVKCKTLAHIHGNMTHMTPNLLHVVTCMQHEVKDGTCFEPPIPFPPHHMGTIGWHNMHQPCMQVRGFKE